LFKSGNFDKIPVAEYNKGSDKMLMDSMLKGEEASQYNILSLAYIGDAVMELMVRENLLSKANCSPGVLHKQAKQYVSAHAQSGVAEKMLALFTPDEAAIFRRARNTKSPSKPKNAVLSEYSKATAVEAVFGYLYLTGNKDKLKQLFAVMEQSQAEETERLMQ
jgi:ribonuclease-3 family protein